LASASLRHVPSAPRRHQLPREDCRDPPPSAGATPWLAWVRSVLIVAAKASTSPVPWAAAAIPVSERAFDVSRYLTWLGLRLHARDRISAAVADVIADENDV